MTFLDAAVKTRSEARLRREVDCSYPLTVLANDQHYFSALLTLSEEPGLYIYQSLLTIPS